MTLGTDGLVTCPSCFNKIDTNWPDSWDREKDVCASCAKECDE